MEAPLDHGASGCSYAYCLVLILDWATELMGRPIGSGRKALIFRRYLLTARTVNKETCEQVEKTHVFILLQKTILEPHRISTYYNRHLGWPTDLLEETLYIVKFLHKFRRSYHVFLPPWPYPVIMVRYQRGWLKDMTVGQRDVIARQWTESLANQHPCHPPWIIARSAIENRDGQWPQNLLSLNGRSSSEPRIRDEAKHQDPRPRRSRSHSPQGLNERDYDSDDD